MTSTSKKTDYVNAQFDDAEANIEELYKLIKKQDTPGHENEIGPWYDHMTWPWFGSGWHSYYVAWKEKGKVHMVCYAIVWARNSNTGHGTTLTFSEDTQWAVPPRSYYYSIGHSRLDEGAQDGYLSVDPTGDGVSIYLATDGGDTTSWGYVTGSWDY